MFKRSQPVRHDVEDLQKIKQRGRYKDGMKRQAVRARDLNDAGKRNLLEKGLGIIRQRDELFTARRERQNGARLNVVNPAMQTQLALT